MYYFIVNPASHSGNGLRIWKKQIEPALNRLHVSYQSFLSDTPGGATQLASQILNEAPERPVRLVVLGGDGTVNEALNGIRNSGDVILGYIPTGSSNDLARDLGLPKKPLDNLKLILSGSSIRPMDYGIVTYADGSSRRFLTSCGIGYDAAVCEEVQRSTLKPTLNKFGLGKLAYLSTALKQLVATKEVAGSLTLDDTSAIPLSNMRFIASMNHRFEGGGFMFAPNAKDTDGILNLCVVDNISKGKILIALPSAFKGKHFRFKGVTPYSAKKIHIDLQKPMWVHTDGEVEKQASSITITCVPNSLMFLRP